MSDQVAADPDQRQIPRDRNDQEQCEYAGQLEQAVSDVWLRAGGILAADQHASEQAISTRNGKNVIHRRLYETRCSGLALQ